MRVETIVAFIDLLENKTRLVGEVFDVDKKRCEELLKKKLVKILEDINETDTTTRNTEKITKKHK